MDRYYFTYNQIHQTVKNGAEQILASGFEPDYLLAIGAGGFIPARILRTYLNKPIITVTLSYYNDQTATVLKKQQWLDIVDIRNKKILIVDEVDDTRATLAFCSNEVLLHEPAEVAVFVLHHKQKPKKAEYPAEIKHIFVGKELADKWIQYPWDALDIEEHNRKAKNG